MAGQMTNEENENTELTENFPTSVSALHYYSLSSYTDSLKPAVHSVSKLVQTCKKVDNIK